MNFLEGRELFILQTSYFPNYVNLKDKMTKESLLKWLVITIPFLKSITCSIGDNSPFFNDCVKNCKTENCETGRHSFYEYNVLGFGFSLWSCTENCEYDCQWKTVEAFQRKNWSIPQFKGKWPFIRIFGFQEPASVFFSFINLLVNFKLIKLFRKKVSKSSPYFYIWNIFALFQLNSWFWSTVYHSKDNDVTEKLDYMSAFLVILYSLYGVVLRYIGASFNKKTIFWSIFCAILGINHLAYLWFYNFDYGYNMKLNCILGGITLFLWIMWSFFYFQSQPFVWKIFCFAVLTGGITLLELIDFPPILWLVDAHALWHGCSVLPNIFFYLFVIDDCNHLANMGADKLFSRHKTK